VYQDWKTLRIRTHTRGASIMATPESCTTLATVKNMCYGNNIFVMLHSRHATFQRRADDVAM
jgi:hypothetical protein